MLFQPGKKVKMNNFTKGILVGIGIGLLIAPVKGEETRRLLSERLTELRNSLPENEQINQYVGQVTSRVSQTRENLRGYARQAAFKLKDTGTTLGNLAQQSVQEVKQAGQDVVEKTKEASNAVLAYPTTNVIDENHSVATE